MLQSGSCWTETSGLLLVSSTCDSAEWTHHQLHPLLLPLSLLPPPVPLPVRTTHSGRVLSRHLLLLFSGGQQWSGIWTSCTHQLHHTTRLGVTPGLDPGLYIYIMMQHYVDLPGWSHYNLLLYRHLIIGCGY